MNVRGWWGALSGRPGWRPPSLRVKSVAALWVGIAACMAYLAVSLPIAAHTDYIAFYCGGQAVSHHADPYREQPLNACEHGITNERIYAARETVPAPLPGYALALFAPFALLPVKASYLVFSALAAASIAAALALLSRSFGVPALIVIALASSTLWDNVLKGQPVPFVLLALVTAGWAVARGRDRVAAGCAVATLIEPHIGAAVCLALFVWRPRARPVLLLAASSLGVLSLIVTGTVVNVEYFRGVLPAQASSELAWFTQVSAAHLLWFFGVPDEVALRIATAQWLATIAVGTTVAGRAARRRPELVVFLPALFALCGGPYEHVNLLALGLPAIVAIGTSTGSKIVYVLGLAMLMAWVGTFDPAQAVIIVAATCTLGVMMFERLIITAALSGISGGAIALYRRPVPQSGGTPSPIQIVPQHLAESSWAAFVASVNPVSGMGIFEVAKAPNWLSLIALLVIGSTIGVSRRGRRANVAPSAGTT